MSLDQRVSSIAMRMLHGGGSDASDDPDAAGDQAPESSGEGTKSLRIASIFIILAAGFIGALPCLFFPIFRSPSHPLPRVLRAFSAGIIIALALVHMFPDAVEELANLEPLMEDQYPYNVAGPSAIFGAFLMVVLDSAANFFVERQQARAAAQQLQLQLEEQQHHQHHNHQHQHVDGAPVGESAASMAGPGLSGQHVTQLILDPHTHACAGQARMSLEATPMPRIRDQIMAVLFELGCIFHSFIIGLTLGVNTDNFSSVRALVVALSFHQWLEGIALASFIMRAHMSFLKGIFMIALYSLTCPVGIAIGLGISDTYDAESTQAIATQGVFNAVSTGMLLYIGLVQLIAEDFTRRELPAANSASPVQGQHGHAHDAATLPSPHKEAGAGAAHASALAVCGGHGGGVGGLAQTAQSGWWLVASHAALFLGAALMSMLAIWA